MNTESIPAFERYRLIRAAIEHEDNLINQRINWFVSSQAFLFSVMAISQKDTATPFSYATNHFFPLVPLLALACCVLVLISVMAGLSVLCRLRRQANEIAVSLDILQASRGSILGGTLTPLALPVVFAGAWLIVLCR